MATYEKFVSVKNLARRFNCTPRNINKMVKAGRIPRPLLPGKWWLPDVLLAVAGGQQPGELAKREHNQLLSHYIDYRADYSPDERRQVIARLRQLNYQFGQAVEARLLAIESALRGSDGDDGAAVATPEPIDAPEARTY